jgi:hypothetical protein
MFQLGGVKTHSCSCFALVSDNKVYLSGLLDSHNCPDSLITVDLWRSVARDRASHIDTKV